MEILRKMGSFFMEMLQVVIFAVSIFLFLYLLVVQPHKIKGDSMQPNYPDGEYLLTDKVTYRFQEPKRGDVVVFKAPGSDDDEYIKRIMGLPGETLTIERGKILINGISLDESYLSSDIFTSGGLFFKEGESVIIPEDNFFVLGDNRSYSSDSRAWGLVPKKDITGRAWFIYWPPQYVGIIEAVSYTL